MKIPKVMKISRILVFALVVFLIYLFLIKDRIREAAKKAANKVKGFTDNQVQDAAEYIKQNHDLNKQTRQRADQNGIDFEEQLERDAIIYLQTTN